MSIVGDPMPNGPKLTGSLVIQSCGDKVTLVAIAEGKTVRVNLSPEQAVTEAERMLAMAARAKELTFGTA